MCEITKSYESSVRNLQNVFLPVIIYRVVYVLRTYGKNAFYYDES